jgi:drug/metabolite transporter (DMT)-like permease
MVKMESNHRNNLIGGMLMVVSMAAFSVEDALLKVIAETLPVGQILMIFGLIGAAVFTCAAKLNKDHLFPKEVLSKPMRIRVLFEVLGRLFYMLAIALTPLSSATVILQATPVVVVAGAALVFGEKVGMRRWTAIFIGLLGVVIIIGPGTNSFSLLSVFAVLGVLGFAGRDLASRAAPANLSIFILGVYGFLSVVIAGALFSIWDEAAFVRPNIETYGYLAGSVFAGVIAYAGLMKAMRTGDVSAVTPFRYTRLLFGVALGVLLFGEQLSLAMWAGSGLIVMSGLFILWQGKQINTTS